MKTCKNCKQVVNIDTITCPNCERHEFKLNTVKICSLCGKINEKKNKECELCGKSFSGRANDYEIENIMNLVEGAGASLINRKSTNNKPPRERYVAMKGEFESGEREERCAFFIPGELKEKPIILLPSFEESEKVDVYLVLANNAKMPGGMQKIDISKEEDINALNEKKQERAKTSIAAFVLFWLNLTMICAFGLKIMADIMGFQIIAGIFGGNRTGQLVVDAIQANSGFGDFAYYIYPVLLALVAAEMILTLVFIKTKETKAKKIFLIIMQSFIFAFAIGTYLISFLMIEGAEWYDIGAGMILLAACAFAGVLVSIFYQYPKEVLKKKYNSPKEIKEKEQNKQRGDNTELVGFDFDIDNV